MLNIDLETTAVIEKDRGHSGEFMSCAVEFNTLLETGDCTTEQALALFDTLEPASIEDMLGDWCGEGFPTSHPMDGLLEAFDWHGKSFKDADNVDPLVFKGFGRKLVRLNPALMPLRYAKNSPLARSPITHWLFKLSTLIMQTHRSKARLRMLEYRGVTSATMIYDDLPINDIFRKIDADTMMGAMDLKGVHQPFFFVLRRTRT